MEWECAICKRNLYKKNVICYRDKKYCTEKCLEDILVMDENMELYKIIQTNISKRQQMSERIKNKCGVQYTCSMHKHDMAARPSLDNIEEKDKDKDKEGYKDFKSIDWQSLFFY